MDPQNFKVVKMELKVLGTGCAKCNSLEVNTRKAVEELGINAAVTKVEDIVEIMQAGIMTTPALTKDGEVLVKGKVPTVAEIKDLITK